jgi:hypothetical protein
MSISVIATIKLDIDGHLLELTKEQAENLYAALGQALNKTNTTLNYPPGVRSMPPSMVYPNMYPTLPYEVTCNAQDQE